MANGRSNAALELQRNLANLRAKVQESQRVSQIKLESQLAQGINDATTKGIQDFQAEQEAAAQADEQSATRRRAQEQPPPVQPIRLPFQNLDRAADPGAAGAVTPEVIQQAASDVQLTAGGPQGVQPESILAVQEAARAVSQAEPPPAIEIPEELQQPLPPESGLQRFLGGVARSQGFGTRRERQLAERRQQVQQIVEMNRVQRLPFEQKVQTLSALTGALNAEVAAAQVLASSQRAIVQRARDRVEIFQENLDAFQDALGPAADEFQASSLPFLMAGDFVGAIDNAFQRGAGNRLGELADRKRFIDEIEVEKKVADLNQTKTNVAADVFRLENQLPYQAAKSRTEALRAEAELPGQLSEAEVEARRQEYANLHSFTLLDPEAVNTNIEDLGERLQTGQRITTPSAFGPFGAPTVEQVAIAPEQIAIELSEINPNTAANFGNYTVAVPSGVEPSGSDSGLRLAPMNRNATMRHAKTIARLSQRVSPEATVEQVTQAVRSTREGQEALNWFARFDIEPKFWFTGQFGDDARTAAAEEVAKDPKGVVLDVILRDFQSELKHDEAFQNLQQQSQQFFQRQAEEQADRSREIQRRNQQVLEQFSRTGFGRVQGLETAGNQ